MVLLCLQGIIMIFDLYLPFFYFFPRNLLLVQNITPLQISTTRRQSGHCLWQRVSLAEHEILQIQCGREQERERGTTTDKKECEMILVQL